MVRLGCCLLLLLSGCGVRRVLADLEPDVSDGVARPDGEAASLGLRALVAEQDGDFEAADRWWRWLVRVRPEDPGAWAGYGGFLERQQRSDDAIEAYGKAIAIDAQYAQAHLGIARILVGRGNDEDARPHLVAAAWAEDPDAFELLARLCLRHGDKAGAWTVYDVWSKNPPARTGECLDRARLALSLDRSEDAVDDLRCALDDEDGNAEVGESFVKAARTSCRIGTAWRWTLEHRVAERDTTDWRAVAVAVGLAAGDPDLVASALGPGEGLEGGLLADRVDMLVRAGRPGDAIALLDEAAKGSPDPAIGLRRAELLAGEGRAAEALAALDAYGPDDRYHLAAQRLRAEILVDTGHPEEAVALLGVLPTPPWATVVVMARALASAGRADDAEVVLLGSEAVPESERWRQVALLRADGGDLAGALEALDAAGADTRALYDRAVFLEHDGSVADARVAWEAATAAMPTSAGWLGVARTSDDPLPALTRAVETDPCDPVARRLLAERQDPCDAVASLERAWDASPRDPAVLGALARAYPACGDVRRVAGQPLDSLIEGLGAVEWTWRVLARQDEADRVAAVRRAMEGV